jgi:glycosyltransferase involved in cell wall biosynthesis
MNVAVSCFGGDRGKSGIGRYITQVLRAIASLPGDFRFDVLVHAADRETFVPRDERFRILEVDELFGSPVVNVGWHQTLLPLLCAVHRWDVLFLPAGNRRLPAVMPCPTVGTVHDMASLHVEAKYDPARTFYIREILPFLYRRLDRVITVSRSTRLDLIEFAEVPTERIRVIPLAADPSVFLPGDAAEARARVGDRYGTGDRYLLYVSRLEHPGKNHVRLVRAWTALREAGLPHRLVLVGADWSGAEEVRAEASRSRFATDIVFTGFAAAGDLPDLYRGADAVAFPSLFEGFGLPILEAMACGAPVACSNRSSLPEVAGDAALLFDPFDEEGMADALGTLLRDGAVRRRLARDGIARAAEFSWERTGRETMGVLREVAGSTT